MEKRILRLEEEFWSIRTDTGELADAERKALRAYLDAMGEVDSRLQHWLGSSCRQLAALVEVKISQRPVPITSANLF
jgi:hypothetical protein